MDRLREGWYWLKCYAWHRHNRLHIRTLPVTWSDRCDLLPHAMFQILADFIDKECSPGIIDWDGAPNLRAMRDEMQDHYDWWKKIGSRYDEFDGLDTSVIRPFNERYSSPDDRGAYRMLPATSKEQELFDNASAREDAFAVELNRRMKRLVDLTPYMWT